MRSTGTRRGTGTGFGLVAVLVVGAVALLVGANRWTGAVDEVLPGVGGRGSPSGSASSSAPSTQPPSGWAPVTLADTGDGLVDLGGTRDQVALATLGAVVARAPVVVTTPTTSGHVFDGARALAARLDAPLVLADGRSDRETDNVETTSNGETTSAATSAIPTSASPATGPSTSSATPSASGEATAMSVADLLVEWGTSHVVAVAGRPVVHAAGAPTIHDVGLVVTDPPARADPGSSPSAHGPTSARTSQPTMPVGTESPSRATASVSPSVTAGGDDPLHELRLPDTVTAMLDDADAAEPVTDRPPAVVVRAGDDGQPRLRSDAVATIAGLGGQLVEWDRDDPRRDRGLRRALRELEAGAWLLAVADRDRPAPIDAAWAELVQAAAVAPELPGGGLTLFPGRVFVASYGNPSGPALGVLGERDVRGSIEFTKDLAADYEGLFGDGVQVQPAFEIIVTVASSEPEETGDYSRRADLDLITDWVDAATEAGLYVMLDLQPGRTDFLTQAREIEHLLARPNVGLALDPEWRLQPDEVHLDQIGSVTTAEVNEVSAWLAQLVRDHDLPQKLLIIHSFRLAMLTDRHDLVDHPELATMVHVDGQGAQASKDGTYQNITSAGPDFLWWGWKNFYDEDVPGIRSPEDTAAVSPQPNFISYQ